MKTSLIKISLISLSICLTLSCSSLPPVPEIRQCGYSVKFNKFRCCDNVTNECFNLKRDDSKMEAAQCLSADDFKSMETWVQSVIDIANDRCH